MKTASKKNVLKKAVRELKGLRTGARNQSSSTDCCCRCCRCCRCW